jgi:hypothetical protein
MHPDTFLYSIIICIVGFKPLNCGSREQITTRKSLEGSIEYCAGQITENELILSIPASQSKVNVVSFK